MPTAFTDTELFDYLERLADDDRLWVCRLSILGRGWRLHETTAAEAEASCWKAYPTAREAIAAMACQ